MVAHIIFWSFILIHSICIQFDISVRANIECYTCPSGDTCTKIEEIALSLRVMSLSTKYGPCSINNPNRLEPPGPPWSHKISGADWLVGFLESKIFY